MKEYSIKSIRMRQCLAVVSASGLLVAAAPPASALPGPRSEQWWFEAWQIENKVWPLTRGKGVTVGLIDTGVSTDLPDLRGSVVGKRITADGVVDDSVDHDTEKGGHGTGMAALIVGQGRGSGMVGVAPESKILSIYKGVLLGTAIRYAVDHGAKVINMSLAQQFAYCTEATQSGVDYALKNDVVVVASTGNDGPDNATLGEPANCVGVVAVAGLDAYLNVWKDSSAGANVVVAGPAADVGSIGRRGAFTAKANGTSQASALTAGVVAVMRSRYPKMPAREIVRRLLATTRDVGPKGWDKFTGYGAVVPYRALTEKIPGNTPNPVYKRIDDLSAGKAPQQANQQTALPAAPNTSAEKPKGSPGLLIGLIGGLAIAAVALLGFLFTVRRRS
nr:S8 family serine peptidase [Actinomadura rayongensis]